MSRSESALQRSTNPKLHGGSPVSRWFEVRGTGVAMWAMNTWSRARHRLGGGPRLRGLDHVTMPCRDLEVAERFYVGLLGARVLMRVDADFLRRFGREREIDRRAFHTSIVFDEGARIDLFVQPDALPPATAGHPHHAFGVSPRRLLQWKQRLEDAGVPTFGPTRLGPPGQASLYFNDPFGNHLELVTQGFLPDIPVGPPDMTSLRYDWEVA
jgi:catechol 2,3-dioxygenase-like lactoylglutathione lyase family enzyme